MSDHLPMYTDSSTARLMRQQPWIRPRSYWDGCTRYEMYCFLCGASLSDPAADSMHLQGAKHMKRINWPLSYWTPPVKDEWDQVISCSEGDAGAHGSQIQDQNLDEVRDAWGAMVDAATAAPDAT